MSHWCNFLIVPFYTQLSIIHSLYAFHYVVTNSFLFCLIPLGFSLYWIKTFYNIYKTPIYISCFVSQISVDYVLLTKILLLVLFPLTKPAWNFVNNLWFINHLLNLPAKILDNIFTTTSNTDLEVSLPCSQIPLLIPVWDQMSQSALSHSIFNINLNIIPFTHVFKLVCILQVSWQKLYAMSGLSCMLYVLPISFSMISSF